jgi:putative ABC transport system permease protein
VKRPTTRYDSLSPTLSTSPSAAESEIWVDYKDLARDLNRNGYVSSVQLRANSSADRDRIQNTINKDTQFKLAARLESEYYAEQSRSAILFKAAGTLIAVLLTFGAMFAAANTMYAAVGSRSREIGTMRALGFSRFDILISFLSESVLLCALGGALGLLATIPLGYITISTSVGFTEAAISFRLGPLVMTVALVMTLCMGVFGGLFPAIRAVRMDVISALRQL